LNIKALNVKKLNLKTNKIDFSKLRTRSEENNIRGLRTKSAQSSNSGASGDGTQKKLGIKRISLGASGKKPVIVPASSGGAVDTRTLEVKQQ